MSHTPLQSVFSPDGENDECLNLAAPLESLSAEERRWLLYFSEMIAPEMVVLDGLRNGWRQFVLPLAHADDMVRKAIIVAAKSHLKACESATVNDISHHLEATMRYLRKRQRLHLEDTSGKQNVILVILIFLVTTMIDGSPFLPLLSLLEAALKAIGGDAALAQGDFGIFLVTQVRKFQGYAKPFIGQEEGIAHLRLTDRPLLSTLSNGWDCFKSHYRSDARQSQVLCVLHELCRQACQIYVQRASAGDERVPFVAQVEKFRRSLEMIPPGTPGEVVLVFPAFLMALESTTISQREYFKAYLRKHYERNRFNNILKALAYLDRAEGWPYTRNWTQALPNLGILVA